MTEIINGRPVYGDPSDISLEEITSTIVESSGFLNSIKKQMKIMVIHLSKMTGMQIDRGDVD